MKQTNVQGLAFSLSMLALGITFGVAVARGGWYWLSTGGLAVAAAAQFMAYKTAKTSSKTYKK